jgi:hypothetical protein
MSIKEICACDIEEMELWDLDHTFAKFMLPRITAYIEKYGTEEGPAGLQEPWLSILRKIERALCLIIIDYDIKDINEAEELEVQEGLKLFCLHIRDLWN